MQNSILNQNEIYPLELKNSKVIKNLSILQIFVSLFFAMAFIPFFLSFSSKFEFYFALSYFVIYSIRAFKFKIFLKNSNKANLFKILIVGITLISLYWISFGYLDYIKEYAKFIAILPILGFLLIVKAYLMTDYIDFKLSALLHFFYLLSILLGLLALLDSEPIEHAIMAAGLACIIIIIPMFFLFVFFIETIAEFIFWKKILKNKRVSLKEENE